MLSALFDSAPVVQLVQCAMRDVKKSIYVRIMYQVKLQIELSNFAFFLITVQYQADIVSFIQSAQT